MLKDSHLIESHESVIGSLMSDFLTPDALEVVLKENNAVIRSGKAMQFLNTVTFENKNTAIFLTLKMPLYNRKNKIIGILGISHYLSHYLSHYKLTHEKQKKLTDRESDCLTLLFKGKTANEIGCELGLSKRTIEYHLANIKVKLACKSKSALINKVYELGLSSLRGENKTQSKPFEPGDFIPKAIPGHSDKNKI